jgi:hypothetical protein
MRPIHAYDESMDARLEAVYAGPVTLILSDPANVRAWIHTRRASGKGRSHTRWLPCTSCFDKATARPLSLSDPAG